MEEAGLEFTKANCTLKVKEFIAARAPKKPAAGKGGARQGLRNPANRKPVTQYPFSQNGQVDEDQPEADQAEEVEDNDQKEPPRQPVRRITKTQ